LGVLTLTAYAIHVRKLFSADFHMLSKWLMKTAYSLYENNLTLLFFVLEIAYTKVLIIKSAYAISCKQDLSSVSHHYLSLY